MYTLTKNTNRDKTGILQDSIRSNFEVDGVRVYSYLLDFDDEFVYFEIYDWESGKDFTYKASYTFNGTSATFGDDAVEVVRQTEYKEVERESEDVEKSMMDKFSQFLEKNFGGSEGTGGFPLIKQFQEEQMISIEPLYILPDTVDGHGYTVDLEETYAMVKSFNEANDSGLLQTSLFHTHKTDSFTIVKAWVNECESMIGDTPVPEGQPLVQLQFNNEAAWELRKSGGLTGVSIGARAEEIVEVELND